MNAAAADLARAHAPALVVALPILAAALAALCSAPRLAWAIAIAGAGGVALLAGQIAVSVWGQGAQSYAMGGWPAPLGVELRVDALAAFGLVVTSVAFLAGLIAGAGPARSELAPPRQSLAAALALSALTALLAMIVAGDAFVLFVALQLNACAGAALTALGGERDRSALPAAFRQLTAGLLGALLFGLGAGLLYAATGALDLALIGAVLNASENARSTAAALGLMIVGAGVAAMLAPLHVGAAGALGRGPRFAALLGAAQAAAGLMVLARLIALVVAAASPPLLEGARAGLAALAAAGAVFAAVQAAGAKDLARLAAYGLAAQAGACALGLAAATPAGVQGALFQVLAQTLAAFALFAAASRLGRGGAPIPMARLDGLGRRRPLTAATLALGVLTLAGAPLTAGFIAKWMVLQAAVQGGLWWGAAGMMASALVMVAACGRVLERLYFQPPSAAPRAERSGGRGGGRLRRARRARFRSAGGRD